MKATVTDSKPWKKAIQVEIPNEEIKEEFEVKLNKYKKEAKLPGFRQGKVPSTIIRSRFGDAIREEIINSLINKSVTDACTENNIIPLTKFELDDLKMEENQPVSFKVEFEVDPEIEIKDYKNTKVSIEKKAVTSEDIEQSLKELQDRLAEFKPVERTSLEGDYISLETIEVTVDGEPKNELTPPTQPFQIGQGSLKEFDKELVGLTVDQETQISVTFPEDFHIKDVIGKKGVFSIKVKNIREKIVPPIDEDFLKKVGNMPDEKALREEIKKELEANAQKKALSEAQHKAIEQLIEANEFDVPPSKIEKYIDLVMEEQSKNQKDGAALDRDVIEKIYKDMGIFSIKRHRIVEFIAKKEKIKATQEEVDTRIQFVADQYNRPFDDIKKIFRQNGTTTQIREEIKEEKTLKYLIGEIPWETD